jgi:nitrate reductase NapAB chaperone NapD
MQPWKNNVFTGGHDSSTEKSNNGQLIVFTGGHDSSTGMSSRGKIMFLHGVMTIVLQ